MNGKKNLIRAFTVAILGISMTTSIFANTNQPEKKILTLERAISGGKDRENQVAVFSKQITAYNEQLSLMDNIASTSYRTTQYSRDEVVKKKELLNDIIAYNVTVLFNTINMQQDQIAFNEVQIQVAEKELKQAEVKYNNGLVSKFDLDQVSFQLEQLEAEKKKNELTLEDYKGQFLNLTNINIDKYDELEENLTYTPIDYKGGVSGLITKNVDYYMKNSENFLAYQKDNILALAQSKYGPTGVSLDVYYATEAEVTQNEYNIEQQKKKMTEGLKSCAASLEKLEESLRVDQINLENEKTKYEVLKVRYQRGLVSQIEVEKAEQNILRLELAIEQEIYSCNQYKMIIEKPWVQY